MKALKRALHIILSKISPLYSVCPGKPEDRELLEAAQKSLKEWQLAKRQFHHVESHLVEYMIYRLNAAERHFLALITLARTQGVKAWPDSLADPVKNTEPVE